MDRAESNLTAPGGPAGGANALAARRLAASRLRPRFLALHRISFPPGAVASIAHRVSGLLLVLATPLAAYAFARSLEGPEGYAAVASWAQALPARLVGAALGAALAYHLLAGVRHLLMDAGIGGSLRAGRASARFVLAAGLAVLVGALWVVLR